MEDYITPGEFAKLACTTKRTILFYDQKGVLKPETTDIRGFRYYSQRQILDYQMILLLSTLGIPLKEIKNHLDKKGRLADLFKSKRPLILKEMRTLEFNLKNIDAYLENLRANQTMINPQITNFKPLKVVYIEKTGSYSKIGEYCSELYGMLEHHDDDFTTMAIFEDIGYRPKKCHMKICGFSPIEKPLVVKKNYESAVKTLIFNPGKVISYKHTGAGELLSLFWKELERYCKLYKMVVRKDQPDFEIYWKVNDDPSLQVFEIFLPIQ